MLREDVEAKLLARVDMGSGLVARPLSSPAEFEILVADEKKWDAYNTKLLEMMFTTAELPNEYRYAGATPVMSFMESPSLGNQMEFKREDIRLKCLALEEEGAGQDLPARVLLASQAGQPSLVQSFHLLLLCLELSELFLLRFDRRFELGESFGHRSERQVA